MPIIGRDYFFFFRGRTSTRLRLVPGSNAPVGCIWVPLRGTHYNGCPLGHPYVHPVGAHLRHDNGAPYGCPICAPTGCTLFLFTSRTSTRLRLVPGSYNAPLRGAYGYPYGVPIINAGVNRCNRLIWANIIAILGKLCG